MMENGFKFFRRDQNRTESGLQASCLNKMTGICPSFLLIINLFPGYVETGLRPVSTIKMSDGLTPESKSGIFILF